MRLVCLMFGERLISRLPQDLQPWASRAFCDSAREVDWLFHFNWLFHSPIGKRSWLIVSFSVYHVQLGSYTTFLRVTGRRVSSVGFKVWPCLLTVLLVADSRRNTIGRRSRIWTSLHPRDDGGQHQECYIPCCSQSRPQVSVPAVLPYRPFLSVHHKNTESGQILTLIRACPLIKKTQGIVATPSTIIWDTFVVKIWYFHGIGQSRKLNPRIFICNERFV